MTHRKKTTGGRSRQGGNAPARTDRWRRTAVVLLATIGAAVAAEAQTASSLDTLVQSGELTIGDGIYVTDVLGQLIKGDITNLSSTGLTVTRGRENWTLAVSEVKRIERQDSLVNGIMLGVAVGAIPSGFICLRFPRECLYAFLYTTPYMAIGAGVGALVDSNIHKTLFQAPGSARVAVSPMLAKEGLGARLSVTW